MAMLKRKSPVLVFDPSCGGAAYILAGWATLYLQIICNCQGGLNCCHCHEIVLTGDELTHCSLGDFIEILDEYFSSQLQ